MRTAWIVMALIAATLPVRAANFIDSKYPVRVVNDVVYAADRKLTLDLYEPAGTKAPAVRPVFIAIHGGGWTRGTKRNENILELCQELAASGYVCVSIQYRLNDNLGQAVDDTERAIGWVVANAKKYRLDATRIAIGGSSAGAVTALYVAYRERNRHVRAVLSWAGGLFGKDDIVTAGGPPLFIVHGTADSSVSVAQARSLAKRAREARITTEAWICTDLLHNAPLDRRPLGVSLYDHLGHFLFRNLDLAKLATDPLPKRGATAHGDPVACPH